MGRLEGLIVGRVRDAIGRAFGAEFADVDPLVRPTQDVKFGDYQANVAMGLGKRLGKNPRVVAQSIIDALNLGGVAANAEIAGPGFINLRLDDAYVAGLTAAAARDPRLGIPTMQEPATVVIDYSGPNVAKEMHVGHLRSSVIGDALARTLAFLGYRVIRQNHLGDWGTQFGMLIEHLMERGNQLPPDADLTALYREASARDGSDPAFSERARARVVALQSGDAETRRRWEALVALSARQFDAVYKRLDVQLTVDDIRGESAYNDDLPAVIDDLRAADLLRDSNGARCVFLDGFKAKDGTPLPLIVQKSDGGFLYATTDLAALRYRVRRLHAHRIIYLTDARQRQHFQMVFAAARTAGWVPADVELEHIVFGAVLGEDGKPFKTRSGDTVRLAELLDEAEKRAADAFREKTATFDAATQTEIAHAVGIGAIKYADLASDRVKDYVFHWDRMLAMDGNTAPYLQYAYARIRSIGRKAAAEGVATSPETVFLFEAPAERALALQLLQLDTVIESVARSLEPHHLCGYLYAVATAFSAFYESCPVLQAEPALRASRLALCDLTARTLATGLDLLGITVVERM